MAADPPAASARVAGGLTLQLEGRELEIRGAELPLSLAVMAGPGSGPPPGPEMLAALQRSGAQIGVVLGDLGDAPETRSALLRGLAKLPFPTLLLASGRDTWVGIDRVLSDLPEAAKLINISTLRAVRIANNTFVPVAGAAEGRYSRRDEACGFALADLKQVTEALGEPAAKERRWLLSWHAPGGGRALGVARTGQGVDVGSADLAELARRIGAEGGLFAWPWVQAGRPRAGGGTRAPAIGEAASDFRLVVPRISGAAVERADGSRLLPGFALLRLSSEGLALVALEV